MRTSLRFCLAFAALVLGTRVSADQDTVVQLKDDPYRRVVFENEIVRVWEVKVPIGEWTPLHEHKNDQVSIRLNTTVLTNTPKGGLFNVTRDFPLEAGSVSYAEYVGNPYVHKITPKGPSPHHVIEAEILAPAPTNPSKGVPRDGFATAIDNARVHAARLLLAPGKSAELGANGKTFVVILKGGLSGTKELKPGDVEWHGEAKPRTVKNEGTTPIELVEVQVK